MMELLFWVMTMHNEESVELDTLLMIENKKRVKEILFISGLNFAFYLW